MTVVASELTINLEAIDHIYKSPKISELSQDCPVELGYPALQTQPVERRWCRSNIGKPWDKDR